MQVVIRKTSLRPILKWAQRSLVAGAVVMFGYCGFVVLDVATFQHQGNERLLRLVDDRRRVGNALPTAAAADVKPMLPGGVIGRIEIPRLGISVVVVEGTGQRALRRAAGHIQGTTMPGEPGNVGISAHRDTFFRPLRNVRLSDIVTLTTPAGDYRYRVEATKVVKPSDVDVLNSDGREILTLITCYPFYFVGAAPGRFIVQAERIP